jgi:hypothetical protein
VDIKGEDKLAGRSSSYLMPELVPFLLCLAVLEVAVSSSEQTRQMFGKVVEGFRSPDANKAFEEVRENVPSGKQLVKDTRSLSRLGKKRQDGSYDLTFLAWVHCSPPFRFKSGRYRV